MSELKNYESDLEELKELYSLLYKNFTQLSKNKKPTSNVAQTLEKAIYLKTISTKLQQSILLLSKAPKIIKPPINIMGPVTYTYLEGDPGDGVTRKILLLGDVHTIARPCPPSEGNISVANFFRFTAAKLSLTSNKLIDLFIEETFEGTKEGSTTLSGGEYLDKLKGEFSNCLKVDKSQCDENMRIHYADVRHILDYDNSLETMWVFLKLVHLSNDRQKIEKWLDLQPTWDTEEELLRLSENKENPKLQDKNRLHRTNILLNSYRLDNRRLDMIDTKIREKVEQYIMQPLFNQLYDFLINRENRLIYSTIKKIVRECLETDSIIPDVTREEANWLSHRLLMVTNAIMEAYCIVRMLKRVGGKPPARPGVALREGEMMTHIAGYFGYGHIFNLERFLIKLGFNFITGYGKEEELTKIRNSNLENFNQCIVYTDIAEAIDRFCR